MQGVFFATYIAFMLTFNVFASADTVGDKIRARLKNVKRIVIAAAFFGTETLSKYVESKKANSKSAPEPSKSRIDPKLEKYVDYLKKIQEQFQKRLPERMMARTPFEVASDEEIKDSFDTTGLTPQKLFINSGAIQGRKLPIEDMLNVKRFMEPLHADAILMTVLDEPRRNLEHYYFDPLSGLNIRPSHVQCRAIFVLLLPDGTSVFSKSVDVSHPISKIGKRDFLLADYWLLCGSRYFEERTR